MTNRVVRQLDMELFGGCNYKCKMCPQSSGREREFLRQLPFETFKKVVDDSCQHGVEAVSLHGSGEPTLSPYFTDAVKYVKSKGLKCYSFTNGFTLNEKTREGIISSGLDVLRVSAIGCTEASYKKWMSKDAFEAVRQNVRKLIQERGDSPLEVHLYHLLTSELAEEAQLDLYQKNWVDFTGAFAEIWRMHNWADSYAPHQSRQSPDKKRRSCGRPESPILQVRAGGLGGQHAAVVACCMVLGRDSEAVLGHLSQSTIAEVLEGEKYTQLRKAHAEEDFDSLSYCKDCDQLYESPESLVWTNIPDRRYNQSKMLDDLEISN